MSVEIRPVRDNDDPELEKLFRRAFGQPPATGEWHWKYACNPSGRGGNVAVLDGRLVGHLGAWRTTLWQQGRPLPALSVTDSMTDPGARARGRDAPFLVMGRDFFRELENADEATFVWGYPSFRARAFGEKFLGYRLVRETSRLVTDATQLADRTVERAYEVEIRETVPPDYDPLWSQIRDAPGWRLDRSRHHLNWRYHQRPGRYYRMGFLRKQGGPVQAAVVSGFQGSSAQLVELLVAPGEEELVDQLLPPFAASLIADGIGRVETWLNPRQPLHSELARLGLQVQRTGIPLEVRPVNGWPEPALVDERLDDRSGDYDVF